jgi:ABC-type phosphonate transport system ATPase subunit
MIFAFAASEQLVYGGTNEIHDVNGREQLRARLSNGSNIGWRLLNKRDADKTHTGRQTVLVWLTSIIASIASCIKCTLFDISTPFIASSIGAPG